MEKEESKQFRFGLIGKDISYSFSKGYFADKFKALGLKNHSYENFDLPQIEAFQKLLEQDNVKGFNVTIPYKEAILPYLTDIDTTANTIGAVNTIRVLDNGLKGFNTDAYGFQKSLEPHLQKNQKHALVMGTGGASKAILYVLKQLNIEATSVSRTPNKHQISYEELNKSILEKNLLIINCTPLGTHPNIEQKPDLPYQHITPNHLLFDLIYNPSKTAFLRKGEQKGAIICNGHRMLELQAEKSWEIWNMD